MNVVFFGTPVFAANVLSYLLKHNINIVAVVARPDQSKGRSKELVPVPTKTVAFSHTPALPIFQPEKASSKEFVHQLEPFLADLFVVVAYGEILKQEILDMPRLGCINVHASLLPKYRGAAPIQRCIMEGEDETGITVMHMVRKMDAGPMIKTAKTDIGPNETFGQLEEKLCKIGSKLLLEVIHDFEKGVVDERVQNESEATYAPKIELEDCEIDWEQSAQSIHNLIRGVNPYPGAWCFVIVKGERKRLKFKKSSVVKRMHETPGKILSCGREGLIISCGRDALCVHVLQLEGKKEMTPEELFRGTVITLPKISQN